MKYKAGFIGVGNMGGALFEAACRAVSGDVLALYDTNEEKAIGAASRFGAAFVDIKKLVSDSKYVFFGVKPNVICGIADSIKEYINDETVIVSMAAGIDIASICKATGTNRVIRIMPNIPVAVGEGMVLYSVGDDVTESDVNGFLTLMDKAGKTDYIEEKYIDAAAAVSGCGPAFAYIFAEALADGAVKCGLPRDKALMYAKQMILGSGAMMMANNKHPGQLKDEVCSPGGTTIEGVLAIEKNGFRHATSSAVTAAYEKTSKLKK